MPMENGLKSMKRSLSGTEWSRKTREKMSENLSDHRCGNTRSPWLVFSLINEALLGEPAQYLAQDRYQIMGKKAEKRCVPSTKVSSLCSSKLAAITRGKLGTVYGANYPSSTFYLILRQESRSIEKRQTHL